MKTEGGELPLLSLTHPPSRLVARPLPPPNPATAMLPPRAAISLRAQTGGSRPPPRLPFRSRKAGGVAGPAPLSAPAASVAGAGLGLGLLQAGQVPTFVLSAGVGAAGMTGILALAGAGVT